MKKHKEILQLTATDLVGHLYCKHLTDLDMEVASGLLSKPDHYDPLLEILRERGQRHERAYIDHLIENGYEITVIEGFDINNKAIESTLEAMRSGVAIITQAALRHGRWTGRIDILRRVESPSSLGEWSYDVIDTKLARETKGGTVLQLCLYADLLANAQGAPPEKIYVISPWTDYEPQAFRYLDFAAYFRHVQRSMELGINDLEQDATYPEPKEHCDICRWQNKCDRRRRKDDHLCLVANITKNQISELQSNNVATVRDLANMPIPIPFDPQKGSKNAYDKIQSQATIQVAARDKGERIFETLRTQEGIGFSVLPEPSEGDIFFDIEGNSFVGEHGLEYLFGYAYMNGDGVLEYKSDWAFDRSGEKEIFERFIDFVCKRLEQYSDLHIYHYAPYEPSALKRLMGRYAVCESEVDNLLRGLVFVDLLSIVRNSIRASVESYSLKKLEPFFGYDRKINLYDANVALTLVSAGLELDDVPSISDSAKETVQKYNADDCLATYSLRNWLEELRSQLIEEGQVIERPESGQTEPNEELDEKARRVQELVVRLTHDLPVDPSERNEKQQAIWILAHTLDWYRRETKAVWWEYFRLCELTEEELLNERAALSSLSWIETVEKTRTGIPTDRYHFTQQDSDLRGGENLMQAGGDKLGTAVEVSSDKRTLDIKKSKATADIHPVGVFAHQVFRTPEQEASLFRLGEYVASNGICGEGPFKSARVLLLREPPVVKGDILQLEGENTLDAALRISQSFTQGVLPIQGPPGTGKSYTGARMICSLVQQGKKVGITANSHKVIRNLINNVIDAAAEMQIKVECAQKPSEPEPDLPSLTFLKTNGDVFGALSTGEVQVVGGTHFLWSRAEAQDVIDVLVVDEAAQMSLANVLAVSASAPALILLGDPQQLEQPMQGSHPDGTGVSALDHILSGQQTITQKQGLFLEKTWRMHPIISRFHSELFYEDKLTSVDGCQLQKINKAVFLGEVGLRYKPVLHIGNTSASIEEAEVIAEIVNRVISEKLTWTDREGNDAPITLEDILIIAPYNAQVFEILQRLPSARVGTVDKFQGQEAPIAIYSMATSSHADAPRGMEFLYSSNRLNVAISRAKCISILVASPNVFEADCRTPKQMQLANSFCRYLEMATPLS